MRTRRPSILEKLLTGFCAILLCTVVSSVAIGVDLPAIALGEEALIEKDATEAAAVASPETKQVQAQQDVQNDSLAEMHSKSEQVIEASNKPETADSVDRKKQSDGVVQAGIDTTGSSDEIADNVIDSDKGEDGDNEFVESSKNQSNAIGEVSVGQANDINASDEESFATAGNENNPDNLPRNALEEYARPEEVEEDVESDKQDKLPMFIKTSNGTFVVNSLDDLPGIEWEGYGWVDHSSYRPYAEAQHGVWIEVPVIGGVFRGGTPENGGQYNPGFNYSESSNINLRIKLNDQLIPDGTKLAARVTFNGTIQLPNEYYGPMFDYIAIERGGGIEQLANFLFYCPRETATEDMLDAFNALYGQQGLYARGPYPAGDESVEVNGYGLINLDNYCRVGIQGYRLFQDESNIYGWECDQYGQKNGEFNSAVEAFEITAVSIPLFVEGRREVFSSSERPYYVSATQNAIYSYEDAAFVFPDDAASVLVGKSPFIFTGSSIDEFGVAFMHRPIGPAEEEGNDEQDNPGDEAAFSNPINVTGDTRVKATGKLSGSKIPEGATIRVEARQVTDTELYWSNTNNYLGHYEISLLVNGEQIHDNFGTLTVSLPVDSKWNGYMLLIRHERDNRSYSYIETVARDGYVTFDVTDLSTFTVLEPIEQIGALSSGDSSLSSSQNPSGNLTQADIQLPTHSSLQANNQKVPETMSQTGDTTPLYIFVAVVLTSLVLMCIAAYRLGRIQSEDI